MLKFSGFADLTSCLGSAAPQGGEQAKGGQNPTPDAAQ